jgi:two-component system phosphate regulon sensor histidine kinase PhoR
LEGLQEVLRRVLAEGQLLNYELELPDEERRFIQINANTLLDRQSRREGIILECRDLTRLRQLENTRREFVANVSHELRTPLSLIKGFAETLLHGAKDDPEVAERFLRTIEKHADRLTYLIEDLLTLSRLESGQIVMNTQSVGLLATVNQVLADLEPRVREKEVTVINEVEAGLSVRADADRLQQVLFNLVDNAVKYGKHAGQVRLGARRAEGGRVEVRVSDDGPGIPPAALHRIFERFYRADKARSREQGGTGLGLAIVKHIVQFHGGTVWAESAPDQGTTFFFTLPAQADSGE